MRYNTRGVTFLELLVVCVIIAIIAALGLANFAGPKEQTTEREAQVNLKLIAAAEKIYRMEIGQYSNCTGTVAINNNLRLMLPVSDTNWKYRVATNSANTTFQANAQRTSGQFSVNPNIHIFCINNTQENVTNTSCLSAW
jgi:prepilin-type N-terminal cleavage/methylation domain-containing protein